ncbi:MAG: methyltransferase domain-containing protein, partial [Acidobacteriota bacterium]|nr:methyltransferase domain-containing protein [Acidobacteriota bacterium]
MKNHPYSHSISKLVLLCGALILLSVVISAVPSSVRREPTVKSHTAQNSVSTTQHSSRNSTQKKRRLRKPDVIYYPTPPETVAEMLRMARIKKGDVLYDLGSGDGRIPIAAATQYGIRAVGIEIDPKLVTEAEENARQANVSQLVRFRNEDMFRVNYSEA